MSIFKRAFASKEVKAALGALDEAAYKFQHDAFQMVRDTIEKLLLKNSEAFERLIRESGGTPREWVYSQIGNIAGDMLESGNYHVYRGLLNPLGAGKDLLTMFDASYDELVQMKAIDLEYAVEQKAALRKNLQNVG